MANNSTNQARIEQIQRIVENLAGRSEVEVPRIVVKNIPMGIAHANIKDEIEISPDFLARWENGFYNNDDVEVVLAHELGHIIDGRRGAKIWFYLGLAGLCAYVFILPVILFLMNAPLLPIFIVIIWAFFFPVLFKWLQNKSELRADAYALELTSERKFANFLVNGLKGKKRSINPLKIWRIYYNITSHPGLSERLSLLEHEVDNIEVRLRAQTSDNN